MTMFSGSRTARTATDAHARGEIPRVPRDALSTTLGCFLKPFRRSCDGGAPAHATYARAGDANAIFLAIRARVREFSSTRASERGKH